VRPEGFRFTPGTPTWSTATSTDGILVDLHQLRRCIAGFIAAPAGRRDEMREVTGVVRRTRATGRKLAAAVGAVAILLATIGSAMATPPAVALGTAVVDGDPSEWGAADRFADLFVYGDRSDVRGDVYARYDCDEQTLVVYVTATDGDLRSDEPNETWVRIDDEYRSVRGDAGNDGVPPDFEWVGYAVVDGRETATGFEASMPMTPGAHTMFLHVHQWFTDDDLATSLVIVRDTPIVATCVDPSPSPSPSPEPSVAPSPSPSPDPSPSPEPSVAPSPSPSPEPSVDPSGEPNPSPSPDPSVDPSPSPSPDPSVDPSGEPNPSPSPDPSQDPSPEPSVDPSPSPTGEVGGITFSPEVTPPPTDGSGPISTTSDGLLGVFAGLGLVALAGILSARRFNERSR
jgi:hypothetical protein